TIQADIYAKQYFETDPQSNQASSATLGEKVDALSSTFHTDAQGKATIPITVSELSGDYSQSITVQVTYKNGGVTAAGGASTIIHQGNGVLDFGSSPTVVYKGGKLVARVYATNLAGQPLANAPISYMLMSDQSDEATKLASGTATANSQG